MIFDDKFDTWFMKNFAVNRNGKILYLITSAYMSPSKVALVYKAFLDDTGNNLSNDMVLELTQKITEYCDSCIPKKIKLNPVDIVRAAFAAKNLSDDQIRTSTLRELNFIALCYNDNLQTRVQDFKIRRAVKFIKTELGEA